MYLHVNKIRRWYCKIFFWYQYFALDVNLMTSNLTVKVILVGTGYCVYEIVSYVYFVSFSLHPLFPGSNEVDQIAKIHDIMGTPDSSVLDKLKKWVLLQLLNSFFYPIFQSSCYLWLLVYKSPVSPCLIFVPFTHIKFYGQI